jgi:hypothetical protein
MSTSHSTSLTCVHYVILLLSCILYCVLLIIWGAVHKLDVTPYRVCFPAVKLPGRDAQYVHPYSAEVQTEWSYTSTTPVYLHFLVRAPLPLPDWFVSTSQQLGTSYRCHKTRNGSIWIFSCTNCSPFAFVVTTFPGGSRHWLHYNGASRERKLGSRSMLPSPSISHSFQDSPPLRDNSRISAVQHRNRQWRITHGSGVRHVEDFALAVMFQDGTGRWPRTSSQLCWALVCVPGEGQVTCYCS